MIRIMLEAFVLKSILYVYQMLDVLKKLPPKSTKIYQKKIIIFA